MNYEPVSREMLDRIRARESRRGRPPIDWASLAGAGWRIIATPSELPGPDRLREFYRLRKQGRDWAARHGATVKVRRENGARTIYAEVTR
jgi:hypothetical protein